MKSIQKKSIALSVLVAMLALVSVFCYGTVALASIRQDVSLSRSGSASTMMGGVAMNMSSMDSAHCGEKMIAIEKSNPVSNSVMPCCVDRHDNVPATTSTALKDRMKFSDASLIRGNALVASHTQQEIYLSYHAPPPRPDKISCILRLE